MAEASRLGDITSSCPRCPHGTQSVAVEGSKSVLINNMPALRVGDGGMHGTCCETLWAALAGSPTVYINNRRVVRKGDATACNSGKGMMLSGSANVRIGESRSNGDFTVEHFSPSFILMDRTGKHALPLSNVSWVLSRGSRIIEQGSSNDDGLVKIQSLLKPLLVYELRYPGRTIEIVSYPRPVPMSVKGHKIRLATLGYHPGPLNNTEYTQTKKAVIQFQLDFDIPSTGELDQSTVAKLLSVSKV